MKFKTTTGAIVLGVSALVVSSHASAMPFKELKGVHHSVVTADSQGGGNRGLAIALLHTAKAGGNAPALDIGSLRACGGHCPELPPLPSSVPIVTLPPVPVSLPPIGVSAVPEPESYLMMLAGLGLVGYMARRKKRSIG